MHGYCNSVQWLAEVGIKVIGVGGIRTWKDVRDYRRVNCSGVQVGTACFHKDNLWELQHIGTEYLAFLAH